MFSSDGDIKWYFKEVLLKEDELYCKTKLCYSNNILDTKILTIKCLKRSYIHKYILDIHTNTHIVCIYTILSLIQYQRKWFMNYTVQVI